MLFFNTANSLLEIKIYLLVLVILYLVVIRGPVSSQYLNTEELDGSGKTYFKSSKKNSKYNTLDPLLSLLYDYENKSLDEPYQIHQNNQKVRESPWQTLVRLHRENKMSNKDFTQNEKTNDRKSKKCDNDRIKMLKFNRTKQLFHQLSHSKSKVKSFLQPKQYKLVPLAKNKRTSSHRRKKGKQIKENFNIRPIQNDRNKQLDIHRINTKGGKRISAMRQKFAQKEKTQRINAVVNKDYIPICTSCSYKKRQQNSSIQGGEDQEDIFDNQNLQPSQQNDKKYILRIPLTEEQHSSNQHSKIIETNEKGISSYYTAGLFLLLLTILTILIVLLICTMAICWKQVMRKETKKKVTISKESTRSNSQQQRHPPLPKVRTYPSNYQKNNSKTQELSSNESSEVFEESTESDVSLESSFIESLRNQIKQKTKRSNKSKKQKVEKASTESTRNAISFPTGTTSQPSTFSQVYPHTYLQPGYYSSGYNYSNLPGYIPSSERPYFNHNLTPSSYYQSQTQQNTS